MPDAPRFVSWFDPTRECEIVWSGGYLLATKDAASMPSSLHDGVSQGPVKALGAGGSRGSRGSGLTSQTAMRA